MDTVEVVDRAGSGDSEILTIFETGPDTGKFAGFIQTSRSPPAGRPATIAGSAVEPGDKTSTIESLGDRPSHHRGDGRVSTCWPIRSAIVFDSARRQGRLSGARVTLVNDATGQPAQVFGDDGASAYPSHRGQRRHRHRQRRHRLRFLAPAIYRFPLVRPGIYRLRGRAARKAIPRPSVRTARRDGRPSHAGRAAFHHRRRAPTAGRSRSPGRSRCGSAFRSTGPRAPILLDQAGVERRWRSPATAVRLSRIEVRNPDAQLPTGPITVTDPSGRRCGFAPHRFASTTGRRRRRSPRTASQLHRAPCRRSRRAPPATISYAARSPARRAPRAMRSTGPRRSTTAAIAATSPTPPSGSGATRSPSG